MQIEELQSQLVEKFDQLSADELVNAQFFVATNGLNVRAEATTKSPVITVIYPNQKVRLIKQQGQWLYVEYFDFLKEVTRMGWVYKRYLKPIDSEPME